MFSNRIRNAALALAGAALIATSLVTSVAVAAPSESQPSPAHAETVAAQPKVNVPRADASIMLVTMDLNYGRPKYKFVATNHGPDQARFKVKVEAGWRDCQGCDPQHDRIEETVTLNSGTAKDYFVECKGQAWTCSGAVGFVDVVGIDPYPGNNTDYILH